MLSGAYLGNSPSTVADFEEWLGAEVDYVRAFSGRADWSDFVNSVSWVGQQLAQADRPLLWTIPMFANQGSLEAAARGDYDAMYQTIAASVLKTSGWQDEIVVRIGEEFNGTWMTWSAAGHETAFIDAYRSMVDVFRSVSDKFVFEWNVNLGGSVMNPADAYPGDNYVDIVSMDFYYNTAWDPKDPVQAWDYFVHREYGLQWLEDFADQHGKPTAYSEWGINSDAPAFVEKAFEWFRAHDVVYQSYWYSNADFAGVLNSSRPGAAAAFLSEMLRELTDSPVLTDFPVSEPALSGRVTSWTDGTPGNDTLTGGSGNDYLNGAAGRDTTAGRGGDDTYIVDQRDDVVVEDAGQGTDTVQSWALITRLAANVENLVLLNQWGSTGFGNGLANRIAGSAGADTIDGGGGNDWLTGGAGADTFVAGTGYDVITDFTVAGASHDKILIADVKFETFADLRAAMDQVGSDTRIELHPGSALLLKGVSIGSLDASHFDLVPLAKYAAAVPGPETAAPQNWLIGTADRDDLLVGGSGRDYLNGGGGTDTTRGLGGDDTYMVDRAKDVVIEAAGQGIDTVQSWARSYTLGANVENLVLLSTWGATGIGNGLANRITGNAGADIIRGGGGDDWLTGGKGADTFVFDSGHDVITDFTPTGTGHDVLKVSAASFASFDDIVGAMKEVGSHTVLLLSPDDTVVFHGLAPRDFVASDFAFG